MVALLRDVVDDVSIARRCRERGVNVSPLSMQYRHAKPRHGLLIGYAAASSELMQRGIGVLHDIFREQVHAGFGPGQTSGCN